MELINENDLQNVCGGKSCKEVASALAATGVVLLVCGAVVVSILEGDIKIETVIRCPVISHAQSTKVTQTTQSIQEIRTTTYSY